MVFGKHGFGSPLTMDPVNLEGHVVTFLDWLSCAGFDVSAGEKAVAALISARVEMSRHGAVETLRVRKTLKAWKRLGPQRSRKPLPFTVIAAIANWMVAHEAGEMGLWVLNQKKLLSMRMRTSWTSMNKYWKTTWLLPSWKIARRSCTSTAGPCCTSMLRVIYYCRVWRTR